MPFIPTVRKPTGIPAAPLIVVSGIPKSGKSVAAYKLGRSPRIQWNRVIDIGEGSADEYAKLGSYELLEWGNSWHDLADTVRWAVAQPSVEGQMNAITIDSGSDLWGSLKDRASTRARSSKKNKQALAADPNAEIDVSMNYWNDAANTWGEIIGPLKLSGHIVGVVLVQADEVAVVVNGAPNGQRTISLQCHKSLPQVMTAHVQVREDHSAWLIEVRSLEVQIPKGGLRLDDENPLGQVIDLISPAGGFAAPAVRRPVDTDIPVGDDTPYVDPVEERASQLFEAIKKLSDVDRNSFKAWAAQAGHKVTMPGLIDSAALRSDVAKELERLGHAAAAEAKAVAAGVAKPAPPVEPVQSQAERDAVAAVEIEAERLTLEEDRDPVLAGMASSEPF